MTSSAKQIPFNLKPLKPLGREYFVRHSGVDYAASVFERSLKQFLENPTSFHFHYVFGPSGCGKTHFLASCREEVLALGVAEPSIVVFDLDDSIDEVSSIENSEFIAGFTGSYNRLKSSGGLMIVASRLAPVKEELNPHVGSRILSGQVLELSYPLDSELRPLLLSLSERHNLRLTEYSLNYLLRRLPRNPLSFYNIFASISQLSLAENRRAGLAVVKQAVKEAQGLG